MKKGILATLAMAALMLLVAGGGKAFAAACTCTSNANVSATATGGAGSYSFLDCTVSGTACTVTDPAVSNGISRASHLELNNDCASTTVTVRFNGGTAVAGRGLVIATGQHMVYDIGNAPTAVQPTGTINGSGFVPPGTFSIIASGSANTCFNIGQW